MTSQIVRVTPVQVAAAKGLLEVLDPGETPDPWVVKIANARRRPPGEILPSDRAKPKRRR